MKTEFKVEIDQTSARQYTISIGVGRKFPARNLQEVGYALEHYFRDGLFHEGSTPANFNHQDHVEHAKECDCCPLCRETEK